MDFDLFFSDVEWDVRNLSFSRHISSPKMNEIETTSVINLVYPLKTLEREKICYWTLPDENSLCLNF